MYLLDITSSNFLYDGLNTIFLIACRVSQVKSKNERKTIISGVQLSVYMRVCFLAGVSLNYLVTILPPVIRAK